MSIVTYLRDIFTIELNRSISALNNTSNRTVDRVLYPALVYPLISTYRVLYNHHCRQRGGFWCDKLCPIFVKIFNFFIQKRVSASRRWKYCYIFEFIFYHSFPSDISVRDYFISTILICTVKDNILVVLWNNDNFFCFQC